MHCRTLFVVVLAEFSSSREFSRVKSMSFSEKNTWECEGQGDRRMASSVSRKKRRRKKKLLEIHREKRKQCLAQTKQIDKREERFVYFSCFAENRMTLIFLRRMTNLFMRSTRWSEEHADATPELIPVRHCAYWHSLLSFQPIDKWTLLMADLEAVLADVSYLMAMEKSKSTPAASASKKIVLPDRT